MTLVVCIKQVPAATDVSIDPETKRLRREGVETVMNPFDLYAVEEAVRLRERLGGEVIAVSMGPKRAQAVLREALAIGADRGCLLNDRAFAGSDTWATSYALACAIRQIGDVDLVLCGKQAVDGDTAQVGPGIAAHLNWPQATYVARVISADRTGLVVSRMHETGQSVLELELPAVLTVVKGINQPRVPSLRQVLSSRRAHLPLLSAADIGADPARLGLDGSPTRVVSTAPPPARETATTVIQGDPDECARTLVRQLRRRSLL